MKPKFERMFIGISVFILLAVIPLLIHAEIYKWVDKNGNVHFTDRPPANQQTEQVSIGKINTYASPKLSTLELTPAAQQAAPQQVIMYSTSWCGVCKRAKQYFQSEGIDYVEYDVEKDAQAAQKFRELGGRGVPVIIVGNKRLNGFTVASFERIYRN